MISRFFAGLAIGLLVSLVTGRWILRSAKPNADPKAAVNRMMAQSILRLAIDAGVLFAAYLLGGTAYGLTGIATGLVIGPAFWILSGRRSAMRSPYSARGGRK